MRLEHPLSLRHQPLRTETLLDVPRATEVEEDASHPAASSLERFSVSVSVFGIDEPHICLYVSFL